MIGSIFAALRTEPPWPLPLSSSPESISSLRKEPSKDLAFFFVFGGHANTQLAR